MATVAEVIAARTAADKLLRLYREADMAPTHWIGEDEQRVLWEWPALEDGWRDRHRYDGDIESLVECDPRNAIGTRWPGVLPL